MPLKISSLSLEYVRASVEASEAGVLIDPTGDTVQFAFKDDNSEPGGGDWVAGTWETDSTLDGGRKYYFARCLVGPGGTVTLVDGKYKVWLKVTDNPEVPVRRVGVLHIE